MKSPACIAGLVLLAAVAFADVPQTVPYQGRLTDAAGDPVADGSHNVRFTIYDAPSGGATLWNSGFQSVTTVDGLFAYDLGSIVALPHDLFTDTSRWLGITVDIDPELTPRTKLASHAYAYHALRADTAAYAGPQPGVTQFFGSFNGELIVPDFANLIVADSILCPDSGYVIADLNISPYCLHDNGQDIVFFIWIDTGHGSVNYWNETQHLWYLPASLPTGQYATIMHKRAVFKVEAGWKYVSGLALHQSGDEARCAFQPDGVLTLLYIPNAYNRVAPLTTSGASTMQAPERKQ